MLQFLVNQAIVSTFSSETPKAEDCHATRYSITLSMDPAQHKAVVMRLGSLITHMVGSTFEAAQMLLEKEAKRVPSTHSGLISIDCWGEDQSFSGLRLNGMIFPYEDPDVTRVMVLSPVEVWLSCRVMTKKDKTVVLAWTCHQIDITGLKPEKKDGKKT